MHKALHPRNDIDIDMFQEKNKEANSPASKSATKSVEDYTKKQKETKKERLITATRNNTNDPKNNK